jgi:hypothetical protein
VEHDSDHNSISSTPSANFKATGTPPDSGTARRVSGARVAFTASKQAKVFQSPIRLLEHQRDKNNGPGKNRKVVVHSIETDDSESATLSKSGSDNNECEHSDADDYSCLDTTSDHEEQSKTSQDSADDASDSDDDSDDDASRSIDYSKQEGTTKKHYLRRMVDALRSSHLSGERLMCWSTLEVIANALSAKYQGQARRLADAFRNPDGTCSVPLWKVLKLLERSLEDESNSKQA